MKKIILFILITVFFYPILFCQTINISGFVSDKNTGEKLTGVSVYNNKGNGTVTNEYGFFSLNINKNDNLNFSYIGYKAKQIYFKQDTVININLNVVNNEIDEVVISSCKNKSIIETGTVLLSIPEIKQLPALGGETDIVKAIQLLPGIQSGTEGTTGIFVRGGSSDQNLIILDDVPMYNISHLFGFLSVFNENAVKNVKIIKSGFPARYGGRLSSVIDIITKDGNMKKFTGSYEMGLLSSKFLAEGPLIKNKSSFLLSARRTWTDLITIPVTWFQTKNDGDKGNEGYFFYDINAKYNYIFSHKNRFYINFFHSADKQFYKDKSEHLNETTQKTVKSFDYLNYKWKNTILSARFNHIFNKKLFSNTTAYILNYKVSYYDEYNYETGNEASFFNFSFKTGLNDYGLSFKTDYIPTNKHYIKSGVKMIYHYFKPSLNYEYNNIKTTYKAETSESFEYRLFAEDNYSVTSDLKANIGIHFSIFSVNQKVYKSAEPRLAVIYLPFHETVFKISYDEMQQYIHLLTQSGIGMPTDTYVPVSENIPPQKSKQTSFSFFYNPGSTYKFSVETYYKKMSDLIAYKEGANTFFDNLNYQKSVVSGGTGKSYGCEFSVNRQKGKLKTSINYTISKSTRQFEQLNNGKEFPFKYDRRHDITISAVYDIKKNISINFLWVYTSGNSVTLPVGIYHSSLYPGNLTDSPYGDVGIYSPLVLFPYNDNILFGDVFYYGGRNSVKLPAYHRADISINFKKRKKRGVRTFKAGFYNVYNHKNPFLVTVDYDHYFSPNGGDTRTGYYEIKSLFSILPFISYGFIFN